MPSRQKAKGNNFEREIAKHLSGVFDSNFERVPTSGAITGGVNSSVLDRLSRSQKLLLEGDLIPPDDLYNIKIECKHHKDFSFSKMLTVNKKLDDWIDQAKSDNLDKVWFLIFKINNKGSYVCCHETLLVDLSIANYLMYSDNIITTLDGFFEKNKETIARLCG
jgi:hypothetical protein